MALSDDLKTTLQAYLPRLADDLMKRRDEFEALHPEMKAAREKKARLEETLMRILES